MLHYDVMPPTVHTSRSEQHRVNRADVCLSPSPFLPISLSLPAPSLALTFSIYIRFSRPLFLPLYTFLSISCPPPLSLTLSLALPPSLLPCSLQQSTLAESVHPQSRAVFYDLLSSPSHMTPPAGDLRAHSWRREGLFSNRPPQGFPGKVTG